MAEQEEENDIEASLGEADTEEAGLSPSGEQELESTAEISQEREPQAPPAAQEEVNTADAEVLRLLDEAESVGFDAEERIKRPAPLQSDDVLALRIEDIKAYRDELNKLLFRCENLKLMWVEHQFQKAFYDSWKRSGNLCMRKAVLMDWRIADMKKKIEKRRGLKK